MLIRGWACFAACIDEFKKGWALIAADLELGPPQPLTLYLGCIHERKELRAGSAIAQVMSYNLEDFLKSSVELYVELFSTAPSMTVASSARVATPCTPETREHAPAALLVPVATNTEQSEVDLTDVEPQGGVDPAESAAKNFHTEAARVVVKVMCAARMARPDLLRSIAYMARYLTKRTEEHDTRLHRLMAYISNSMGYGMYAWSDAGASSDPFVLLVFSDADYAGCAQAQRSTTCAVVFLTRKGASVPLSFLSQRQSCVSKSTSEAEIVAMDTSLRLLPLPLMLLAEEAFGSARIQIAGDSQRMLFIL